MGIIDYIYQNKVAAIKLLQRKKCKKTAVHASIVGVVSIIHPQSNSDFH